MRASRALTLSLLVALAVSGCDAFGGGVGGGTSPPQLPAASLGRPGEEVRIRGTVLENRNMMPVDGLGILRIDLGGEEAEVVYGYGEWPPCPNDRATGQGISVRNGERVEIHGVVGEGGELKTCESETYYIQRI